MTEGRAIRLCILWSIPLLTLHAGDRTGVVALAMAGTIAGFSVSLLIGMLGMLLFSRLLHRWGRAP